MSKEQECFNRIKLFINYMDDNFDSEDVKVVDKALKEYVSIKEVDPSAALECLEEIEQKLECYINGGLILLKDDEIKITTIKQALIQAEQDKKKATCWDIVVKKNVDMLLIKKYDNVSDYNSAVWLSGREKLTEEEFNTLKEVLE